MGSLVVVGFPKAKEADLVRRELVDIQREQLIALDDAVVVEHDAAGQVHLRQSINLTAAGAIGGSFWGTLVGLLFLNPLLLFFPFLPKADKKRYSFRLKSDTRTE